MGKPETEWLSIRLSASESEAMTLLRASYELQTLNRVTIKERLRLLINDALEKKRAGKLTLPLQKTTPVLQRGGAFEHIAWQKTEAEDKTLRELCLTPEGSPLPYSQADAVRELLKIEAQALVTAHALSKKSAHGTYS